MAYSPEKTAVVLGFASVPTKEYGSFRPGELVWLNDGQKHHVLTLLRTIDHTGFTDETGSHPLSPSDLQAVALRVSGRDATLAIWNTPLVLIFPESVSGTLHRPDAIRALIDVTDPYLNIQLDGNDLPEYVNVPLSTHGSVESVYAHYERFASGGHTSMLSFTQDDDSGIFRWGQYEVVETPDLGIVLIGCNFAGESARPIKAVNVYAGGYMR